MTTFNSIINEQLCFSRELADGTTKNYFYIGIMAGEKYVMCEALLPHEINSGSFWEVSKGDLKQEINDGKIILW